MLITKGARLIQRRKYRKCLIKNAINTAYVDIANALWKNAK